MKRTRSLLRAALALPLLAAGCVTINVYFPEAAVKSLSQAIEEEVRGTRAPGAEASPSPGGAPEASPSGSPGASREERSPQRRLSPPRVELARTGVAGEPPTGGTLLGDALLDVAGSLLSPASASAQEVAPPEVSSPTIRKIIDSRKARVKDVDRYKGMGVLGENNHADLEVRSLEAVSDLKERAAVQRLVKDENGDRDELFREIAAAKKVDASQTGRIRETYAETLREFAKPGEWIQMKDGAWKKK